MDALIALPLNLLLVLLVIVPVLLFARHQRARRDEAWASLARERGLHFEPGTWLKPGRIHGEAQGVPVQIRNVTRGSGKSQQLYTVAEARLPGSLPEGLALGREGFDTKVAKLFGGQDIQVGDPLVDEALRVRGRSETEIRQALAGEVGHRVVQVLASHHRYSRVDGGEVVLESHGNALRPRIDGMLDDAVALVLTLADAFERPWWTLAERHGLALSRVGRTTVLQGSVDGMAVSVRAERESERFQTRIRVSLPFELPGGLELRLARRDGGEGRQGVGLGDPVLDGLVAATARDPAAGRALVAAADPADDLHGRLLGVLHGHPGSVVTSHEVVLRAEGVDPAALDEQLQLALDLARVLARTAQRMPGGAPLAATPEADAATRARAAQAQRRPT